MNKTVSISLAGFSFTIEEQAYKKLSDYLGALQASLEPHEAHEVMHDIELRIVEIFNERMSDREVANESDVEAVISHIGTPEQIDEQEQEYTSKDNSGKAHPNFNAPKQLFRDPNNKMIGGVSSGLAAYLGIDIIWVRLVFILLIFLQGFGVLLYIILWFVVPNAKTTNDFLKMRGEQVTFDSIKEQSGKIVKFASTSGKQASEFYQQNKQNLSKSGDGFLRFLGIVAGCITGLVALSLFLGSITFLFGNFLFSSSTASSLSFAQNINFFLNNQAASTTILILGFLSLFIPAIIFTLLTIKLFSPKTKLKFIGWLIGIMVVCWIGLAIFLGFSFSKLQFTYNGTNKEESNISINTPSDSIIIEKYKTVIPSNFKSYWNGIFSDKQTIYEWDYVEVNVKKKDSLATPYLVVKKSAEGYNHPLNLRVPVRVEGNKILLPNYFNYPYEDRLRDHRISYDLYVSKNTKVIGHNVPLDFDDDDEDNWKSSDKSITIISQKDSISINKQKYAVKDLEKMDWDDLLNIADSTVARDFHLSDGKKEILIKDGKIIIKNGDKEVKIVTPTSSK